METLSKKRGRGGRERGGREGGREREGGWRERERGGGILYLSSLADIIHRTNFGNVRVHAS